MAETGIRIDDGSNVFASNCFPVRSIFGHRYDGGGAWLVEQHAEQRRRFKAILCTKPRTYSRIKEERKKSEIYGTSLSEHKFDDEDEENAEEVPVLDGFFLMKHCCVEDPSHVCSVNIAGKELTDVKEEDLALFDNVAYVNAGENYLPFEAFRGFPIIRDLEMPLNGLRSIKLNLDDYPYLEMLDLSYNNLSSDDVMNLGQLQSLRVLHLTGNNFRTLPADMALPYTPHPSQKTQILRYSKLEVLMLDDNRLSDVNVFAALAGLQRLHHLNMEKNQIAYVPQLKSEEGKVVTQDTSSEKRKTSSRGSRSSRRSKSRGSNSGRSAGRKQVAPGAEHSSETVAVRGLSLSAEEVPVSSPEVGKPEVKVENSETKVKEHVPETDRTSEEKDLLNDDLSLNIGDLSARIAEINEEEVSLPKDRPEEFVSQCPFPELRYLNLAHNLLEDEESLLAVAAWPMLTELLIHNNPLTTNHSGDPPLLKRFLEDRLGIKCIRKEVPSVTKPHVEVHPKKHRKVSGLVPKVPKPSVEERLMLEAPPELLSEPHKLGKGDRTLSGLDLQKPLPPISSSKVKESPQPTPRDAWSEEDKKTNEDAFFMTQVDDQDEENQAGREVIEKTGRRKVGEVDDKYRGYEILLTEDVEDSEEEEDTKKDMPKDIQGSIRALKYTLDHALVYRDPSVHLEKVSRPVKQYRRVPVPPSKPKTYGEKVDDVLENLRTRTTVEEADLGSVLKQPSKYRKEFPEAQSLLQQIQRRYNVVRVSSMKEAREARKHLEGAVKEVNKASHQLDSLRKRETKA